MGLTLSIQAFLRKEQMKILMVGLDGAGKTALLYKLQLGKIITTITTTGLHVKKLEHENISITAWDVGHKSTGNHFLWFRDYCQDKHGLIFLVDSNDRDRIAEARAALHTMLQDGLLNVPLLVFANKQDLPTSMSAGEIEDKLGLSSLRRQYWHIYNCCATTGEGLYEGLDWLSKCISYQR